MASHFAGFASEALEFFGNLGRNNNRDWFLTHKHVYEEQVRAPMQGLVEVINHQMLDFAPDHVTEPKKAIYRIYRDTRFSRDKTPYKTHIAAHFPRRGLEKHAGGGYYFSVAADGVEVAGGVYMPGPEQLLSIRKHLAEHHEQYRRLVAAKPLRSLMGELQGEALTRAPKGFPQDHPAADLLRRKQLYFYVVLDSGLATTPKLQTEVLKRFRAMAASVDFLNAPLLMKRRESRPDPAVVLRAPSSRRRGLE